RTARPLTPFTPDSTNRLGLLETSSVRTYSAGTLAPPAGCFTRSPTITMRPPAPPARSPSTVQEDSTHAPCIFFRSSFPGSGFGGGAGANPAARATATSSVRVRMIRPPCSWLHPLVDLEELALPGALECRG